MFALLEKKLKTKIIFFGKNYYKSNFNAVFSKFSLKK